jgi:D-alanyl-D-alanine carboxypeptidase (penicillin-binding protein 5/6)
MAKVKKFKFVKRLLTVSIILAIIAETLLYLRPLPTLQPVATIKNPTTGGAITLPWPTYGQAAIGAAGRGVLETNGEQKSAPISYNDYYSKGGSVAKVAPGEKISEYQALQALMLPSANNFADTLATWAFGSMDKYIIYANNQAKELGLKNTHISDASGFSPQTTSSAYDLVLLGQAAIKDPAIAEIVSQKQATIPEAGTVKNVNWLLGTDNVNGIKTGNTDEALGCFLFSSERNIAGQKVTLIGAIMGAPDLNKAISDTKPIINAADQGFEVIKAVKVGQSLGYYNLPWGGRVQAVAKDDLPFLIWQGNTVDLSAKLKSVKAPQDKGAAVGAINGKTDIKTANTSAVLAQPISKPSWKWRIFDR